MVIVWCKQHPEQCLVCTGLLVNAHWRMEIHDCMELSLCWELPKQPLLFWAGKFLPLESTHLGLKGSWHQHCVCHCVANCSWFLCSVRICIEHVPFPCSRGGFPTWQGAWHDGSFWCCYFQVVWLPGSWCCFSEASWTHTMTRDTLQTLWHVW